MTVPLADLVATAEPLRAWLESLPPDEVAGEARKSCDCPDARFLRANGYSRAEVGYGRVFTGETPKLMEGSVRLSKVHVRFTELVDEHGFSDELTAKRCLALLDRAEREVEG